MTLAELTTDPWRWLLVFYMTCVAALLIAWWWTERKTITLKRDKRDWED